LLGGASWWLSGVTERCHIASAFVLCQGRRERAYPTSVDVSTQRVPYGDVGERLQILADARKTFDPENRLLNSYFRGILN
jgi:hypothetical protein